MSRCQLLVATAALAAAAAAVVGCGSGGGDSSPSKAKAPPPRPVPRLAGSPVATAQRALRHAKLKTTVTRVWNDQAAVGAVTATRPATGVRLASGRTVALTVSKGPAPGPYGTLTAGAIGPVSAGAPTSTVDERFGPPDTRRPTSEPNSVEWVWNRPAVRVFVNSARKVIVGYCTTSPKFKTSPLGVSVGKWTGSAIAKATARGPKPAVLAPDVRSHGARRNLMLSAAKPGSYPALIFNVDDQGDVIEVCGGRPNRPD